MRAGALLLAMAILAGCNGHVPYYYEGVATKRVVSASGRSLGPGGFPAGVEARLEYHRNITVQRPDGTRFQRIQIGAAIANSSARPVEVARKDLFLADDEGRQIQIARLTLNEQPVEALRVDPGRSFAYRLYFDFPPGVSLAQTLSLRVYWTLRHEGALYVKMTKFNRLHRARLHDHEPGPWHCHYCRPFGFHSASSTASGQGRPGPERGGRSPLD